MKMHLELHIPDFFFDSAKEENDFESFSERISSNIIQDILGCTNVCRGDDKKHEPDYIANGVGYEVTFGISDSLITALKRIKPFDKVPQKIEQDLIESISNALKRKSEKNYSCRTNLIVFTLTPLLDWYSEFYLKQCSTYPWWESLQRNRNNLFELIIEKYIGPNKAFDDVFIVQPTHDEHYVLYSIKKYEEDEPFMTLIGMKKEDCYLLPRYKLISYTPDETLITYEISEVMYTREGRHGTSKI